MSFRSIAIKATGILLAGAVSATAQAGAVDLSGWVAQGGTSAWTVEAGNNSVLQSYNGQPTTFFDPTALSTHGTALNGKIQVISSSDDDYIGFVLGYQSGEITGSSTDFFLVDWKQQNQGIAQRGLAISHVTSASTVGDFWAHTGGVTEIARGNTLFNTGWNDYQEYDFNIVFNAGLIEVKVNGIVELTVTPGDVAGLSSFSDGAFGFYNYSQAHVRYSAIEQANCTNTPSLPECQTSVPEAPSVAFLIAGLLGAGILRKMRNA
ncbi:MAG: PEP-CTERM sorting domain-containing protein [Pseudomonadota bacterium]